MQKKSNRKDSVRVNTEKLRELMNGMSLRAYSDFLSSLNSQVPYKTLQRMKNGQPVNEINIHAIAKAHGITFNDLIKLDIKNFTKDISILNKVDSVNQLYSVGNFSFFRLNGSNSPGTVISNRHYLCTVDKETSGLIKSFLEKTMGENTRKFFRSGKDVKDEFDLLDSMAEGNEIIQKLENKGIYIFYGQFRRRQIASVNTPFMKNQVEEIEEEVDGSEEKKLKTIVPCLVPLTIYNEVIVFREVPYKYNKLKIFPDEGYSFDELKKDYLKVLKQQLQTNLKQVEYDAKDQNYQQRIDEIVYQTEEWLDYQEKEKNWIFNLPDFDNPSMDFNFHNALPLTHSVRYDEGLLDKFKFHYRNIKADYLVGAKALGKDTNAEKEKEDDHVDTSS